MWKIRGKNEVTVIAMILIALALILYILTTSDVLVDSYVSKERSNQASLALGKPESVKYISPRTVTQDEPLNYNEVEERIMSDLREDNQDIAGKILAPQRRKSSSYYHPETKFNMLLPPKQENNIDFPNDMSSNIARERNVNFIGHRIVHLDLKGAPPKVTFYEELFPFLKSLGATGILIEYEDMFPYYGVLSDLPAYNAYKRSDIKHILKLADASGLIVIPLIQTFGHLEFVLKLEKFIHLREVSQYPQVICPTHNDTIPVLTTMINQIMELHPLIKYLHIGCDEVYYLGNCERCGITMIDKKWTKAQLFLNHVIRIAKFIRKNYPNVKPLTWDDEFRNIPEMELQKSKISEWVEPVIWNYTPEVATSITSDIWEKYISVFPSIWIASAFKGATGPDQNFTDIDYHLKNHQGWMHLYDTYNKRIKFQGIMLTGWQRYDHFAVLCELLPVGLPSLAISLIFIQDKSKGVDHLLTYAAELLKCDPPLSSRLDVKLTHCGFPGASILSSVVRLNMLQQSMQQYLSLSSAKGWFTSYNILHSFSSPSLVQQATAELDHSKMDLTYIKKDMINAMSDIFDNFTIREWIETYIQPVDEKLESLWEAKEKLLAKNHWPRRPLDMSPSVP